jgi:hypothetical protein
MVGGYTDQLLDICLYHSILTMVLASLCADTSLKMEIGSFTC